MRPIRLLCALTLAASAVVFLPGRAFACSCAPPPGYPAAVADADAVFSGTVVDHHDPKAGATVYSSGDPIEYVFEVDAVAKGDVDPDQSVFSARDSASCGFGFTTDKRYLVFGYKAPESFGGGPKALETHLCTKTHPLAPNEPLPIDAEPMGGIPQEAPAPGVPTDPTIPDDGTSRLPLLLALASAAVLAGGAALIFARR